MVRAVVGEGDVRPDERHVDADPAEPGEGLDGGGLEFRGSVGGVPADADLRPGEIRVELIRQRDAGEGVDVDDRCASARVEAIVDELGECRRVRSEVPRDQPGLVEQVHGAQGRAAGRPRVHGTHADLQHLLPRVREPLRIDDEARVVVHELPRRRLCLSSAHGGDPVGVGVRHAEELACKRIVVELDAAAHVRGDHRRRMRHVQDHRRGGPSSVDHQRLPLRRRSAAGLPGPPLVTSPVSRSCRAIVRRNVSMKRSESGVTPHGRAR